MKIKAKIEIYTTQESKIKVGEEFTVDYFDDNKGLVWLKKEGENLPAGDTYVSLACFTNFFEIESKKIKGEMYKCPSIFEDGKIMNCNCGKCTL